MGRSGEEDHRLLFANEVWKFMKQQYVENDRDGQKPAKAMPTVAENKPFRASAAKSKKMDCFLTNEAWKLMKTPSRENEGLRAKPNEVWKFMKTGKLAF